MRGHRALRAGVLGRDYFLVVILLLGGTMLTSACTSANVPTEDPVQVSVVPDQTATAATLVDPTSLPTQKATETRTAATLTSVPTSTNAAPTLTPVPTETATLEPSSTPVEISALSTPEIVPILATEDRALPTPQGIYSWTLHVPILMYHYISIPPEGADKYRIDLSVSPQEFRRQMIFLAENDFTTIDFETLSLAIANKGELPEKPVIITFDDGYRDNYDNAFPVLQELGQIATFFVVSDFIDSERVDYLSWPMAQEMSASGMRIEAHSKTHPDLSGKEWDAVLYEILGSAESIGAHLGRQPRYFAYPGGRYDETTIEVLKELDFWGAVTTAAGDWHGFGDRYEWSRVRMRNTTTLPEFEWMVDPKGTVRGKPPENE